MKKGKVLGKGLNALISESEAILNNKQTFEINIKDIIPGENQPRKNLKGLDKLADAIREQGVIQPIIVSDIGNNKYQLIAGERRWRASKLAGLEKIPAIIKDSISLKDNLVMSLMENLQREDLNPIEEAEAYQVLIDRVNLPVEYLSRVFGKDRSTITNIIRLLSLPPNIKDDLRKDLIQEGHARPLINIKDTKLILDIRNKIVNKKISVREVERIIKGHRDRTKKQNQKIKKVKNIFLNDIEEKFQEKFATKVKISGSNNKGKIIIEYYTQSDLDRFLEILDIS